MRKLFTSFAALMMLAAGSQALAMSAAQSVEKEVKVTNTDGTFTYTYEDAKLVVPGETIRYRLDFINDGDTPVSDLVLKMPVPAEVIYVEDSAGGISGDVLFSADGGQSFYTRSGLNVITEDNAPRPAASDDITHVRWVVAGPVAVGEEGVLYFKGVLR